MTIKFQNSEKIYKIFINEVNTGEQQRETLEMRELYIKSIGKEKETLITLH